MAFWRATDVDLPQNSAIVTVNTGDDVGTITTGYLLQINSGQILEVKTVNTGANPQTIELYQIYAGTAINGGSAIAAPTQGAIKEATEELRSLRTTYESLADSVSSTATPNSVARRNGSAQLLIADATQDNHAMAFGQYTDPTDFGLATSDMQFQTFDVNTLLTTGNYLLNSSSANLPPVAGAYFLQVVANQDGVGAVQFAQRRTSASIKEIYYRQKFENTWSSWFELYHSGNSVNPLDYGIGNLTTSPVLNNNNIDTHAFGGMFRGSDGNNQSATFGDNPFPTSSGAFSVISTPPAFGSAGDYKTQIAQGYVGGVGTNRIKIRSIASSASDWTDWNELYHDGNSVNPLDYGIGLSSTALPPTINNFDTNKVSGLYRTSGGEVGTPLTSSIASVMNLRRTSSNGINQLYLRGDSDSNIVSCYLRGGVDSEFSDWVEMYHSGNTNFNEFGGLAINDVIGIGATASSSLAVIYLPLNSKVQATGVSITGTFKLRLPSNGSSLATGLVPSFITASSNKFCALQIFGSGFPTGGSVVELLSESSTSKITVNF